MPRVVADANERRSAGNQLCALAPRHPRKFVLLDTLETREASRFVNCDSNRPRRIVRRTCQGESFERFFILRPIWK